MTSVFTIPGLRACMLLLGVSVLAGCNHLHISNRPNPPLPTVLAAQNPFLVTFTVVNSTDHVVEVGEILAEVRSTHFTSQKSVCHSSTRMTSPRIEANGGLWKVVDYSFSDSSFGLADPCYCSKSNNCKGNVWVQLFSTKNNVPIPGPDTAIQINFQGSGTIDDISVSDQSL